MLTTTLHPHYTHTTYLSKYSLSTYTPLTTTLHPHYTHTTYLSIYSLSTYTTAYNHPSPVHGVCLSLSQCPMVCSNMKYRESCGVSGSIQTPAGAMGHFPIPLPVSLHHSFPVDLYCSISRKAKKPFASSQHHILDEHLLTRDVKCSLIIRINQLLIIQYSVNYKESSVVIH